MKTNLRSCELTDMSFLRTLYSHSRAQELAGLPLPPAQKTHFINMQFDLQDKHYRSQFPNADFDVIVAKAVDIGRMIVDRNTKEIRLVDITLAPQWQGQGIGSALISKLLKEGAASSLPVTLSVYADNRRAHKLYCSLGFEDVETSNMYTRMQALP